jgi:hypothetical protein
MNAQKRTDILLNEAKKLGLVNPVTGDGMPTHGMIAEAISDAEGDAVHTGRNQIGYSIALQRAIERHCAGELVPEEIAKLCPHHAQKLNTLLANKAVITTCSPKE